MTVDQIVASIDEEGTEIATLVAQKFKTALAVESAPDVDIEPSFTAFPVAGNGKRFRRTSGKEPQNCRKSPQVAGIPDRVPAQEYRIGAASGKRRRQSAHPPFLVRRRMIMQVGDKYEPTTDSRRYRRRKHEAAEHYPAVQTQTRTLRHSAVASPIDKAGPKRSGQWRMETVSAFFQASSSAFSASESSRTAVSVQLRPPGAAKDSPTRRWSTAAPNRARYERKRRCGSLSHAPSNS